MQVEIQNITKQFGSKLALDNISIKFTEGKIHALLGENGAGKSTLSSIICGDGKATNGSIFLDGKEVSIKNNREASSKGIFIVRQRPLLVESLSIEENILLGAEKRKLQKKAIKEICDKWNINISMKKKIRDAGGDERFYTSLLASLIHKPEVLILDEPSSRLTITQRKNLYNNLEIFAKDKCNIIVITHSPQEASLYADTVTILEKGKLKNNFSNIDDYRNFIGIEKTTELNSDFSNEDININACNSKENKIVFECENVSYRPKYRSSIEKVSFNASSNEITIIKGTSESGLGTLEDIITGMAVIIDREKRKSIKGLIKLFGQSYKASSFDIKQLRKNKTAIVASNKAFRASAPDLTVKELLTAYCKNKNRNNEAIRIIKEEAIDCKITDKVSSLSGGMLQRLILGRELSINPNLLILCEPIQGMDSQSINILCKRLRKIANEGKTILILTSTDFPEKYCDSKYILEGGFLSKC
ncbi:MAG: ATP-binding cassette domain-containing protein [Treponema sp.]|nr:ATP-binding cassette domain-containing protein [Treponema sp.]